MTGAPAWAWLSQGPSGADRGELGDRGETEPSHCANPVVTHTHASTQARLFPTTKKRRVEALLLPTAVRVPCLPLPPLFSFKRLAPRPDSVVVVLDSGQTQGGGGGKRKSKPTDTLAMSRAPLVPKEA